jgi:hypothetical protein
VGLRGDRRLDLAEVLDAHGGLSDQSKVAVARVALFAPATIRLHPVKLLHADLL